MLLSCCNAHTALMLAPCVMQHARQYVQYLTEKEQERHDAMVKAEKQLEQFRLQQDDLKRKALEVGL